MLNIPESVKRLYKEESVQKQLRIHFPNGELPDITNSNIVRESLHFTESICSQNVFRFGLAEASVLEFETVGIGNMYGYTIEASIGIDIFSLSAEELAEITSGSWDGRIAYGAYFWMPLGTFRVEKCPRNHGAMTHRKVTAYSVGGENVARMMSPFEEWKQKAYWSQDIGTQLEYKSLESLVDANIGYFNPDIISAKYTKTQQRQTSHTSSVAESARIQLPGGGLVLSATGIRYVQMWGAQTTAPKLVSIEVNDFDNTQALNFIETTLTGWGIADQLGAVLQKFHRYIYVDVLPSNSLPRRLQGMNYPGFTLSADAPILYLPDNDNRELSNTFFFAPVESKISLTWTPTGENAETVEQTFVLSESGDPATLYMLDPVQATQTPVSFPNSGSVTQYNVNYYSYADCYKCDELLPSYAEASGQFWKDDRNGSAEIIELDPSSPLEIAPGDYDEMWWDEYDISPIGTVTVTYRDGADDATASVTLGAGASVYDMTDNTVMQALQSASLDSITELLSGQFATNAANVGFTPIELTMQGWPWLEAGDALEITAEDGTVVNSYALRVEMQGLQHLQSYITADGGEIIAEV